MCLQRKGCKLELWGYGSPCHHKVLPNSCTPYPYIPEPLLQSFTALLATYW